LSLVNIDGLIGITGFETKNLDNERLSSHWKRNNKYFCNVLKQENELLSVIEKLFHEVFSHKKELSKDKITGLVLSGKDTVNRVYLFFW